MKVVSSGRAAATHWEVREKGGPGIGSAAAAHCSLGFEFPGDP